MREVITLRNSPFSRQLSRLKSAGGSAASAARKAQEIIGELTLGGDCSHLETNHGESRIKHCVKYDLPAAHRLVTIQPQPDLVVTCFLGTHADAERWLTDNAGLTVVYSPETRRLDIVQHARSIPAALPPAFNLPPAPKAFASDLPAEAIERLLPGKALRRAFAALSTESTDDEVLSFCDDVADDIGQERSTALFEIICALREGSVEAAKVRIDLALGAYVPVTAEEPVTEAALRDPVNAEHVIILSDLTPHDWEVLGDRKKFDDWMVWLHPDQKRITEVELPGPTVLDGVSGSGKTCVLVHRARHLAQKFEKERILVLTLNRSLVRLIDRLLKRLCSPEEKARIEVLSFHEYLCATLKYLGLEQFLEAIREPLKLTGEIQQLVASTGVTDVTSIFAHREEAQIAALWDRFFGATDSGSQRAQERLRNFLVEASGQPDLDSSRYIYEELCIAQSVGSVDQDFQEYRTHERSGRSLRFGPDQRETALRILQTWLKFQIKNGALDESWLTQAGLIALTKLKQLPEELRFRAVLIDEYQDFSSLELDLIRKIPTATANGLFLTGDHAQRIHTKHLDFDRAGLGTIERRRIRKNYRNSRQILEAGQALLEAFCSQRYAKEAGVTVLPPEYAARNSARPLASQANSPISAAWACAREWVESENPPCTVCIITAAPNELPVDAIAASAPAGLRASKLSGDYIFDTSAVVVSSITAVKGFEFGLIVIVGLDEGVFPRRGAARDELWRDALRLYVAITRARDELRFIHSGPSSPFLLAMSAHTEIRNIGEVLGANAHHGTAGAAVVESVTISDVPVTPPHPDEATKQLGGEVPLDESPARTTADLAATVDAVRPAEAAAEPQNENATSEDSPPDSSETTHNARVLEQDVPEEAPQVMNGYTLIPTPTPCSQNTLCRLLGLNHTEVQLACYDHGLFLTPEQEIPRAFVAQIMDRYDCIPVFRTGSRMKALAHR